MTMAAQKICLGVEISQDELKVALVNPARKTVIKIDTISTPDNAIENISVYASTISSWAHGGAFPTINSVAVAFPAGSGIMRLVEIPKETKSPEEYVNWEFNYATGLDTNDYHLGTSFYPNEKKPERAIVAAMDKKLIEDFSSEEISKSGFKPDYLMSDIFVLHNLLESSEGLGSQVKCILKVNKTFAIAFWSNASGPLSIRLLPEGNITPSSVLDILESGFKEFPKAKRSVKFCGEFSADSDFTSELSRVAKIASIDIQIWKELSKFTVENGLDISKIPQCMGAIGATLSCEWDAE